MAALKKNNPLFPRTLPNVIGRSFTQFPTTLSPLAIITCHFVQLRVIYCHFKQGAL